MYWKLGIPVIISRATIYVKRVRKFIGCVARHVSRMRGTSRVICLWHSTTDHSGMHCTATAFQSIGRDAAAIISLDIKRIKSNRMKKENLKYYSSRWTASTLVNADYTDQYWRTFSLSLGTKVNNHKRPVHASPAGYSSRRYSTNQTTYSCPGPGSMY